MTSDPSEEESRDGHLRPTGPAVLVPWAAVGLVLGWLLRPVSERVQGTAPVVTWLQPLGLLFVAAVLGAVAWLTWRTVQSGHGYLDPQRALNRFVLARACALVGALVAGGYLGYAVSWLGVDTDLAQQRVWRSALTGLAGVAVVTTALLLERACRVRSDDEEP